MTPVVNGLALNAMGSVIAFDRIIREPVLMLHGFQISHFFVRTLDKLGVNLPLPNGDTRYLDIGSGLVTNTCTIYFCYLGRGTSA
jgi:hypothetical protein